MMNSGISLHRWFADWMSPSTGGTESGTPLEILARLGVPKGLYAWAGDVPDSRYPVKDTPEGPVPDLQSRGRATKRRSGQFYTPEPFVRLLLKESGLENALEDAKVLDPACGDGGFLIPLARRLADCPGKRSSPGLGCRIHGYDLDPEALLICLARLRKVMPGKGWPVLDRRDFLLQPPEEKFGIVIGNPPYRVNLPPATRSNLAARYSTAEGEKDLYTFFLEGAVNALEKGGHLLMLTSHTYLVNHQCARIRCFLFLENSPKALYLLPPRFFPSAPGVLGTILHLEKGRDRVNEVAVRDGFDPDKGRWKLNRSISPRDLTEVTGVRKAMTGPALTTAFDEMESVSVPLGSIATVGVGIQESTNRGTTVSRFVSTRKETDRHVKVLRGREVSPFFIEWEGKFLDYGEHLTYAGDPEIFRGEKILYQNIRNEALPVRLVAAYDRSGFFPKNSLSFIGRVQAPYSLLFLAGLLNSPILNAWFRGRYFSFHVTVSQVRTIPVPKAPEKLIVNVETVVREILEAGEFDSSARETLSAAVLECYFPVLDPERRRFLLENALEP